METSKKWWRSAGVMGSLATLVIGLATIFGLIPDADAAQAQAQVTELLLGLGTLVAGAVSLWGRIRASRKVKL